MAKPKAKAKPRGRAPSNRWLTQAQADAELKFAPAHSALAEALQTARDQYGASVNAGRTTAGLTRRAIGEAEPRVQQIYSGADRATQANTDLASRAMAALTGQDAYKAAFAGEQANSLQRLGDARTRDLGALAQEGVAAQAGAQYTQLQARKTLEKAVGQLISKSQATAAEQGAFASSESAKLAHEAEVLNAKRGENEEDNATSTANSVRTQEGENARAAAKAAAAAAKAAGKGNHGLPKGVKLRTPTQHEAARNTIQKAREWAFHTLRMTRHFNYNKAYQTVAKGRSGHKDPATGNSIPAIAGLGEGPIARAAVDLAYFGAIGKGTAEALHRKGFTLHGLEYPLFHPPKK